VGKANWPAVRRLFPLSNQQTPLKEIFRNVTGDHASSAASAAYLTLSFIGVKAAGKSLKSISAPLQSAK
jgi:hypothetical protein